MLSSINCNDIISLIYFNKFKDIQYVYKLILINSRLKITFINLF